MGTLEEHRAVLRLHVFRCRRHLALLDRLRNGVAPNPLTRRRGRRPPSTSQLMFNFKERWIKIAGLGATLLVLTAAAQQPTNKQCLECHSDKELIKTNQLGKTVS